MATVTRPLSDERAQTAAAATSNQINELLAELANGVDRYVLRPASQGREIEIRVPRAALELLGEILEEMGRGNSVTVVPYHAELTTQEAAELLNVSRPHVVKLIETDKLPARKVGTHRRIAIQDLLAYKQADDERRRKVADELAVEAQRLGLGYR